MPKILTGLLVCAFVFMLVVLVAICREGVLNWQAERGDAVAQRKLGDCYANWYGVITDRNEAIKWYRKAAEQGNAEAQFKMGIYSSGMGCFVSQEENKESLKWFRKAAEQGHASAQNLMGWRYANGWGVKEDTQEAIKWFRLAAEQGVGQAQWYLGDYYAEGKGVEKNKAEAIKWLRKAAKQEYAPSGFTSAKERLKELEGTP